MTEWLLTLISPLGEVPGTIYNLSKSGWINRELVLRPLFAACLISEVPCCYWWTVTQAIIVLMWYVLLRINKLFYLYCLPTHHTLLSHSTVVALALSRCVGERYVYMPWILYQESWARHYPIRFFKSICRILETSYDAKECNSWFSKWTGLAYIPYSLEAFAQTVDISIPGSLFHPANTIRALGQG